MKKLLATMLAVIMVLCAMLCASACGGTSGETSGGTNSGSPSDPDHTKTDPSGSGDGGETEDKEYSDVLTTVLTTKNAYYSEVINKYRYGTSISVTDHNEVQALPYGFYEDENLDVAGVKNNDLSAGAHSYIRTDEPKNLYVATNVETKTVESDYYATYLLKYELSDAELKDLNMLFEGDYILANFFVQELSYAKKPTVLSEFKIEVESYKGLLTELNKQTIGLPQKISCFNIPNYETNEHGNCVFFNFYFATKPTSTKNICPSYMGRTNMIVDKSSYSFINNEIFKVKGEHIILSVSSIENIRKNLIDATSFDIRDNNANTYFAPYFT